MRPIMNIFSPVSGWNADSYIFLALHTCSSVVPTGSFLCLLVKKTTTIQQQWNIRLLNVTAVLKPSPLCVTKCGLSQKPQELNELIVCLSVLYYRIVLVICWLATSTCIHSFKVCSALNNVCLNTIYLLACLYMVAASGEL